MKEFAVTFRRQTPPVVGENPEPMEPLVRKLRFTSQDAVHLKKKFGKPMIRLFREDVFGGMGDDGMTKGEWDLEVVHEAMALGITRGGNKVNAEQVQKLADAHIEAGGALLELILDVMRAACYSGIVTGNRWDIDEAAAESEVAVGKRPAPQEGAS